MSGKNLNLFDDDDDDVLDDVEAEEFDLQLEEKLNRSEKKTTKLIELQSKFAHDSRFKIDEQFLEDDEDDQDLEPKTEIEEEKSKNLAILEQVLGKRIHQSKPVDPVNEFRKRVAQPDKRHAVKSSATAAFNSVLTPRFDPTKAESKVFELEDEASAKKRKVNIDFDELDRRESKGLQKKPKKEPALNSTSAKVNAESTAKQSATLTENYYEVSTNLKDTLAGAEDFSLGSFLGLSAFEEPSKAVSASNEKATYEPISELEKKKLKGLRNPFKYDSSDEEDKWDDQAEEGDYDEEGGEYDEEAEEQVQVTVAPPPQLLGAFGGFFFRADDVRLKQDLFYAPELIEKARASGKERSLAMMRALGFRKRAAQKNVKSDEKFAKKRKLLRMMHKGKRRPAHRRNFVRQQTKGGYRTAGKTTGDKLRTNS